MEQHKICANPNCYKEIDFGEYCLDHDPVLREGQQIDSAIGDLAEYEIKVLKLIRDNKFAEAIRVIQLIEEFISIGNT